MFFSVPLTQAGSGFEDAFAVFAEHITKRKQFAFVGERARYLAAIGYHMQQRARRGEAKRAGTDCFVDHVDHGRDVFGRRGRFVHAPFAHGSKPNRRVADHAANIDALVGAIDPLQVLAIGRPVPRQTFEDCPLGDVFDALHHLGKHFSAARGDRSEGHAAVAKHRAGDAVPTARCLDGIPCDLRVEMGMNIDETGCHDAAIGVDFACA